MLGARSKGTDHKTGAAETQYEFAGDAYWRTAAVFLRHRYVALALGLCAFEIAFYFAYAYGMGFTPARASPLWLPESILLCALLRSPKRYWWLFVVAPLPVRLFTSLPPNHPVWFLLGSYAVDSAKALAAAFILRRVLHNPVRPQSFRDLGWFALVAALIVPAVTALGGAGLRHALGHDFWSSWSQWFIGNAVTQLLVTPAILNWLSYDLLTIKRPTFARGFEFALTFGGLVVTSYLAFQGPTTMLSSFGPFFYTPILYLPIPFLYWAAIRFGMAGASIGVPIFALFAITAANGAGFAEYSPAQSTLFLQNFLIFRALPVYLVAVLIEQRNRTERSLSESEIRFRTMANSAPVLIWMSGLDKRCTFFNQTWLGFTGRSMDAELGSGWTEGVHPDDTKKCFAAYLSAFDTRRPFEIEYRLRRRDGQYRWVVDTGVPRYDAAGDFAGYIGCAIDVTDRRQAEETNRHFAHVQRLALIGELSAAIAHEVRQPLNAIRLHAKTLEKVLRSPDAPSDDVGEIVADIESDTTRADEIIDRIRRFLRRSAPAMEALDMKLVMAETARLVSDDAHMRRIEIELAPSDDSLRVLGDRTQIMQVLLNLVLNGMQSMESSAAGQRRLTLRAARRGDAVDISVADRGTGISPEAMPQLFESFFTTRSGGMGLGLSIARSIIEAHNGRIWAQNNSDGGATFYVSLPVLAA